MTFSGRVALVTGAGGGLGRAHALRLAADGVAIVVNDPAPARDGESSRPAQRVVDEIRATGGRATPNFDSCTGFPEAQGMVDQAVDEFGRLDVLINNAGFVRDRMVVSMTEEEFDSVLAVHVRGHFAPLRAASAYWRACSKRGEKVDAAVINTSSESGLFGAVGQSNYAIAKAGIAALTLVAAEELAGYGVTVNTIVPRARTAMTAGAMRRDQHDDDFDDRDPALVARFVAWLVGPQARHITGQTFIVYGSELLLLQGWTPVARIEAGRRPFEADEFAPAVARLLEGRSPGVPTFSPEFPAATPLTTLI